MYMNVCIHVHMCMYVCTHVHEYTWAHRMGTWDGMNKFTRFWIIALNNIETGWCIITRDSVFVRLSTQLITLSECERWWWTRIYRDCCNSWAALERLLKYHENSIGVWELTCSEHQKGNTLSGVVELKQQWETPQNPYLGDGSVTTT